MQYRLKATFVNTKSVTKNQLYQECFFLFSEFQRQRVVDQFGEKNGNAHTQKLSKSEILEMQEKWQKFAIHMAGHWFNLIQGWIQDYTRGPVKIICYEELVEDPKK